ncbi:MAG TPA: 2-dehydropantoate 2-reductase [Solirubrobacteraceae bacterium]
MTRVAVVGVGSIGATVAAAVQDTGGHELCLCARRAVDRVVVERPDGSETVIDAPLLTDAADVDGRADWVLLAVKAHQTDSAADWLAALCNAQTTVAVLQNGIDHGERVAPLVGGADVLPVVNWCPVEPVAPGRVRQRDALRLAVPAGPVGEAFAALMGDGADVTVGGEFALEAWRKLCVNAVSGVMALAGRPAEVFALGDVLDVGRAMAHECAAVARAEGVALSDRDADELVAWIQALPEDAGSSILTDRRAGRALEWEARNGVIGRLGRRHGVPTPVSDTVAALLHAVSDGA